MTNKLNLDSYSTEKLKMCTRIYLLLKFIYASSIDVKPLTILPIRVGFPLRSCCIAHDWDKNQSYSCVNMCFKLLSEPYQLSTVWVLTDKRMSFKVTVFLLHNSLFMFPSTKFLCWDFCAKEKCCNIGLRWLEPQINFTYAVEFIFAGGGGCGSHFPSLTVLYHELIWSQLLLGVLLTVGSTIPSQGCKVLP